MSLQRELNRLLGTTGVDAQRAANELAGTSGKELLFALNQIAGTTGRGLVHVMRLISERNVGSSGLDPLGSVSSIPTGAVVVGGYDTQVIGFASSFSGEYMTFYDAAGVQY
jgi:hypothetical protein